MSKGAREQRCSCESHYEVVPPIVTFLIHELANQSVDIDYDVWMYTVCKKCLKMSGTCLPQADWRFLPNPKTPKHRKIQLSGVVFGKGVPSLLMVCMYINCVCVYRCAKTTYKTMTASCSFEVLLLIEHVP